MSRHSLASLSSGFAHDRRISKHRVSDDDLFNYVLKVAILNYLLLPKEQPPSSSKIPQNQDTRDGREHHLRLSALSNFSIGDLFRDGSKSVRFPEKLLKVLEQRLQDIAMGKNAAYSDQLVRRTMAKFYGQCMEESFKRQMKENRKVEELILMFATHATAVLKKEPTLANDGWKFELNNHIAQFVKMIRECLRGMNHVSPELLSRLDSYATKLAPPVSTHSDSGYDSASTSRDRDSYAGSSTTVTGDTLGLNVAEMHVVRAVANLFQIPEAVIQKEVDQLKGIATEKAALADLKTCLKHINAGASIPGRREDFDSDAGWQHWRTLETAELQQLMVAMVKANPALAKSTPSDSTPSPPPVGAPRPVSVYSVHTSESPYSPVADHASIRHVSISSRRSMYNGLGDDGAADDEDYQTGSHPFTYLPPNPRKYYKRLVDLCLQRDLDRMLSPEVPDHEEVSLGILSQPHLDLLTECATRWRIGAVYRAGCFLELVKGFYERDSIPVQCVPEALGGVMRAVGECEAEHLMIQDYEYLCNVYGSLFNVFMSQLYYAMDQLPSLKPSDLEAVIHILDHATDSGLLDKSTLGFEARFDDIRGHAREVSAGWYDTKIEAIVKGNQGVNRALPLLMMTDEIEKGEKLLRKRFGEPVLGQLDLNALFVQVIVPRFINDLRNSQKRLYESSMNGPTPDIPIQDLFALYRRTAMLLGIYDAACPGQDLQFDIAAFFEPFVRHWLVLTDNKTSQWVEAAIAADKFEAEGHEGHSSSIVDLFDSLRSPISVLQELEWADAYQEARFFTSLSKTISKGIDMYCRSVESLFLAEMFPRPNEYLQPQKSSAWLEKARQLAATGEKRVEPFNFRPETCVKLNNVEGARKLLDNMYNQMQADRVAEVLEHSAPPVPEKVDRGDRFLFSVKIVIAEELVPVDGSASTRLDTFVTLSDEAGNRLAKTRTIYESVSPRWEETFDISVEKPLWLMVSVRDRALVGKHDTVGRAYLCLDPRRYSDFLSHEVWMDLDTHGRILVRISMEGEKDDILFFFGRAFRSLKRAEGDMLRTFIDKMSPFIRQCLSRNVVKILLKSREAGLDYNKALGTVTALYQSAMGGSSSSEVQIPLPQSEKSRVRPEELTDVEVEQAIVPLFDYFDANLPTLNTYLSDSAKVMVMSRAWKEMLGIIEGLLIPPLSDSSSEMKPLSEKEVDIVFRWLKFLRDYFYANGEGPVPLESIQNQRYRDVLSIQLYYDWHSDALMEECVRVMQQSLGANSTFVKKRAKSVYSQRNLGTIREKKKERKQEKEVAGSEEIILRILRMRPGTSDFISQQLQIMTKMQQEQEKRAKESEQRKLTRPSHKSQVPPVPPLS